MKPYDQDTIDCLNAACVSKKDDKLNTSAQRVDSDDKTLRERCEEAAGSYMLGEWGDQVPMESIEVLADEFYAVAKAERVRFAEEIRKRISDAWYENGYATEPDHIEAAIAAAEKESK